MKVYTSLEQLRIMLILLLIFYFLFFTSSQRCSCKEEVHLVRKKSWQNNNLYLPSMHRKHFIKKNMDCPPPFSRGFQINERIFHPLWINTLLFMKSFINKDSSFSMRCFQHFFNVAYVRHI